jgi:hypothetical protein
MSPRARFFIWMVVSVIVVLAIPHATREWSAWFDVSVWGTWLFVTLWFDSSARVGHLGQSTVWKHWALLTGQVLAVFGLIGGIGTLVGLEHLGVFTVAAFAAVGVILWASRRLARRLGIPFSATELRRTGQALTTGSLREPLESGPPRRPANLPGARRRLQPGGGPGRCPT